MISTAPSGSIERSEGERQVAPKGSGMSVKLVIIGASLGGFDALKVLVGGLPPDFATPVVIVQHQGASGADLSGLLQRYSKLPIEDAEDKAPTSPGRISLAPAGYHLLVELESFALTTEAPVQYARPSIDVTFESAADTYGVGVIGVVLTGAGRDGAAGLARIKQRGGRAMVQDPGTAQRREMPAAALGAVDVDWVGPLAEIAPTIVAWCRGDAQDRPSRRMAQRESVPRT